MIKKFGQFDVLGKRTFVRAVIQAPFRLFAEMNNEACYYYIISGKAKVIAPTEEMELTKKEGVVMRCGHYLNDYLESQENNYCEAIAIHFHPDVIANLYAKEFPDFLSRIKKERPINIKKIVTDALLQKYIESLLFYFDNPALVSDELLELKLKEIILLLVQTENAEAILNLFSKLFCKEKHDFHKIIEANLFNNLKLEELAYLTHLSLSSFKRTFKKYYNTSPAVYIREHKLEKAAMLLHSSEARISEIAFECGFKDLAHFSKLFHKYFNCTPSDFRSSSLKSSELK